MSERCDHIIGMWLDPFPSPDGSDDRLVRQSEGLDVDELFKYCPDCGEEISGVKA